ncbi:MAG: hypothetical protein ACXW53_22225 [Candidatus Binatia bacterium]
MVSSGLRPSDRGVGVEIRRPEGWGGGLKPDSRMIEQKLDTP